MAINTSDSIYQSTKPEPVPVEKPVEAAPVKKAKLVKKALPEVKADPVINEPIANKARWPKDNQADLESVYGKVAVYDYNDEGRLNPNWEASYLQILELPYAMRLSWNQEVLVRQIACNRAVFQSLAKILYGIWDLYGKDIKRVQEARMDLYGGCFCFRPRRTGHALSVHSWGAAIDLDPENNPLGKQWQDGKGMMPKEVISIFLSEGWKWGGSFSNPDPMHFEATC